MQRIGDVLVLWVVVLQPLDTDSSYYHPQTHRLLVLNLVPREGKKSGRLAIPVVKTDRKNTFGLRYNPTPGRVVPQEELRTRWRRPKKPEQVYLLLRAQSI